MKDTCGDVCCCVKYLTCKLGGPQDPVIFGGCHSENPYLVDFFSHIVK